MHKRPTSSPVYPRFCGCEKRERGGGDIEASGCEGAGSSDKGEKDEIRRDLTSNDKFERSKVSLGGAYPMEGLAVTREER